METFSKPAHGVGGWSTGERTVPRYSILAVAELVESGGTVCIVGRMTEVSRKGCYVNTPSTLPLNSSLRVIISRDEDVFTTLGKVIYVHEKIGMGIVFLDPPGDQLQILNSWLASAQQSEEL